MADGRLIPVIIVDCQTKKGIENLVKIHLDTPPGDVESSWGIKLFRTNEVFLTLNFFKPMELNCSIRFETDKYADIIDGIISARALHLQPGKNGDRCSDDITAPKVLIEIPKKSTFDSWNKIYKNHNKTT